MTVSPVADNPQQRKRADQRRGRRHPRLRLTAAILLVLVVLLVGNAVVTGHQSAAATGSTLTVDGQGLQVSQDGPADAPALVLIHGLGASTHWWNQLVPMLVHSYHVIRVDLLGHGGSAKPSSNVYSIPEQANRIATVMDQLSIRHAIVVGHSAGGYVATSLAEQRPDLVTALGLIDTGPSLADDTSDGPGSRLLTAPGIGELVWRLRTDGLLRLFLSSAFATNDYPIPQQFIDDVRGMTYHSFLATSNGSSDYLKQRDLPDRLTVIDKPLLVIFGEQDRRWRVSTSTAEYRTVARATVVTVPGVGHSPQVEDPSRTADILLSFVQLHSR